MPYVYQGAIIEPGAIQVASLFSIKDLITREIENRAWDYLKEIGFDWYKRISMSAIFVERNDVQLLTINAKFERNFQEMYVSNLDIPLKQFEALVPTAPESDTFPKV